MACVGVSSLLLVCLGAAHTGASGREVSGHSRPGPGVMACWASRDCLLCSLAHVPGSAWAGGGGQGLRPPPPCSATWYLHLEL